jgi:release factor glutamine methyltransferase
VTPADPLLTATTDRLAAAGCVAASDEAAELLAAAPDAATLAAWLDRRTRGEPLPWITGHVRFAGHTLHLNPGVYVPRPHTEDLARRAAARLPAGGRAVDLCTGSGAVAAHLRACVPDATVLGTDVDRGAAACARRNGVPTVVTDVADALHGARGRVDVVTAVAPYVPRDALRFLPIDVQRHEPRRALDGGDDGLDLVQRVVEAAAGLLRPGGSLLLELGADQDRWLAPALHAHGFGAVTTWHDDDGDLRGLVALR